MRFTALILVLLMVHHPVMGMDAPPPRKKVSKKHTKKASAKQTEADVLCRRLLATACAIEPLLKSVKDTHSANAAAPQLQELLQRMRTLLAGLEQLPFDTETTQTITKYMTDLTHVTQSYMPLVHQLMADKAYGSEPLMEQLLSHHSENDYTEASAHEAEPASDSVFVRMNAVLNTSLYALCKAVDTATAKDAAETLRECIASYSLLLQELQLNTAEQSPALATQSETDQAAFLRGAHEKELLRLEQQGFYQDPDLCALLQELMSLIK